MAHGVGVAVCLGIGHGKKNDVAKKVVYMYIIVMAKRPLPTSLFFSLQLQ